MIKYLGSKRRLVPVLGSVLADRGARTAADLFTGTTRVAQELKRRGLHVTAVDSARAAHVFARTYVATDAATVDVDAVTAAVERLNGLPGRPGYVTEVFGERARFIHPRNGARIDAIRDHLDEEFTGSPLWPILLTALIEAADRVDSTTGVQMAYLKQWAPRATNDLCLRVPDLVAGPGRAVHGDAEATATAMGHVDVAYLDPPYNQHRYDSNYHVWETLVAWDHPGHYGVACKRVDLRDPSTKSAFNSKRTMPEALRRTVAAVDADLVVVSYNNESWMGVDDLVKACDHHDHTAVFAFDSKRYVGAQIGIHNPDGDRVGTVSHLRNLEYLVVAGDRRRVERATRSIADARIEVIAAPAVSAQSMSNTTP